LLAKPGRGGGMMKPQTVSTTMQLGSAIFKDAMRLRKATANPFALAQRPRREVVQVGESDDDDRIVRPTEILSDDQIARMLAQVESQMYRTLFALTAATGLRPEEACALRPEDLETNADGSMELYIRRSLSWARKIGETGSVTAKFYPPKTRAGVRHFRLPDALAHLLKVWTLACPPNPSGLLFARPDGRPLESKMVNTALWAALRRAGLRRVNFKNLRHSFASGALANRMPITELASRLGHANPQITLKAYSHWCPDTDSGAADGFAAGFLAAAEGGEHKVGTKLRRVARNPYAA
jgi:integrase